jgi:hypothetical protein
MFRSYIFAFGIFFALSGGLEAQDRQHRNADHGPIATLLQWRGELRLSRDQVAQLRRIDEETDQANRPHLVQLRQYRAQARALGPVEELTPEKQVQFDAYMAQARPHQDRILENSWAAMREVSRVLSRAQKERMKELLRDSHYNRERSSGNPPSPDDRDQ